MWDCKNCFCFACMIQSNWGRSPSCKSYAFHAVPAGISGLPGTAVGGLQQGCSTSQMRFCFSHPQWRGRREIGPCTAFLSLKKKPKKTQGFQICISAAVEALEWWDIGNAAPQPKQYKFIRVILIGSQFMQAFKVKWGGFIRTDYI